MNELDNITAMAQTPDQLIPYVEAVSGMKSIPCGDCVLHTYEGSAVLVAYAPHDPLDCDHMDKAVENALKETELTELTVLGPAIPHAAPIHFTKNEDMYWGIKLDQLQKSPRLKNMLKRASRDLKVLSASGEEAWTGEHDKLLEDFCERKKAELSDGSKFIFKQLKKYLSRSQEALLFSAWDGEDRLNACAIGDFSAFSTAFYMFSFRYKDAVPGSSDLLLNYIVNEAIARGYERLNLGLGINGGVEFFKKKWGAMPLFPYVESSWKIKRKSWFARLLGR